MRKHKMLKKKYNHHNMHRNTLECIYKKEKSENIVL